MPGGVHAALVHLPAAHGGADPHHARRPEQGPGLLVVDVRQVLRRPGLPVARGVPVLPAAHAGFSGGLRQNLRRHDHSRLSAVPPLSFGGQHRLKRRRLEGVPRQDGDAFAELFVIGGHPPAEIVVVHAGQIVMDEGIGVKHFHSTAKVQCLFQGSPRRLAEFHGQNRPDALAPGQEAVAHCLLQPSAGEKRPQAGLRQLPGFLQLPLKLHGSDLLRTFKGQLDGRAAGALH